MRRSSNPAFSIASASEEKARLPSSISLFANAVMTAGVPWKRIGSKTELLPLLFSRGGWWGGSGVQSEGATIQLARIFTASAPSAVAPARSAIKLSTHSNARMSSPVGYHFSARGYHRGGGAATAAERAAGAYEPRNRTTSCAVVNHASFFVCEIRDALPPNGKRCPQARRAPRRDPGGGLRGRGARRHGGRSDCAGCRACRHRHRHGLSLFSVQDRSRRRARGGAWRARDGGARRRSQSGARALVGAGGSDLHLRCARTRAAASRLRADGRT